MPNSMGQLAANKVKGLPSSIFTETKTILTQWGVLVGDNPEEELWL